MGSQDNEKSLESLLTQIKPGAEIAHYHFLEKLGEGGMGVVWKARDERLKREVAIKFLPEKYQNNAEWLNSFKREARAVAALNHPSIVTLYSIEEFKGLSFITMEYISGKTFRGITPKSGMPIDQFFKATIPVAQAVSSAHKKNIIHGDLKPANIMVTSEGMVKVLDFGLATYQQEESKVDDLDRTLTLVHGKGLTGTYHYMAPEHITGKPKVLQSDVFSLGVIFYEMLTGKKPFNGKTPSEVIASIIKDNPRLPSSINMNVSQRLDRLVMKCLQKEPDARFASATAMLEELSSLAKQPYGPSERKSLSMAVLPFIDISPTKDQEYFCDGLAEELINALSHVKDIKVKSRTSSFQFKSKGMDSREIGERLEVNLLLEGSIFKYDNHVRVTATLISVADDFQLWSQKYDRELKDIFEIQDEISESIVKALELSLTPNERRAMRQVSTENIDAYEHYLQGRKYFKQTRRKTTEYALNMFARAIELDPNYALAYAGKSDSLVFLYTQAERNPEYLKQADKASLEALRLDPALAEVHVSRGAVLSLLNHAKEAEEKFETAIKMNPKSFEAHYFYARESFVRGQAQKAIEHYEKAYNNRPEDYQAPTLVAQIYDDLGMKDKAADARIRGVKAAEKHLDLNPDDPRALYMGANALVCLGEREEAVKWAGRAYELEHKEPMTLYNLACIYSLANDSEPALECLDRALDYGFAHREWLEKDSNLDSLRPLPRFKEIIERLKNK